MTGRAALRAPDGHRTKLRHAFEVREKSWLSDEALALLTRHDVALVVADTARRFPLSFERTAPFMYVRLHGSRRLYGSRYTDEELQTWAARVRHWLRDGDVYVYFDNDYKAYAPENAQKLQALVAQEQPSAVRAADIVR